MKKLFKELRPRAEFLFLALMLGLLYAVLLISLRFENRDHHLAATFGVEEGMD